MNVREWYLRPGGARETDHAVQAIPSFPRIASRGVTTPARGAIDLIGIGLCLTELLLATRRVEPRVTVL